MIIIELTENLGRHGAVAERQIRGDALAAEASWARPPLHWKDANGNFKGNGSVSNQTTNLQEEDVDENPAEEIDCRRRRWYIYFLCRTDERTYAAL